MSVRLRAADFQMQETSVPEPLSLAYLNFRFACYLQAGLLVSNRAVSAIHTLAVLPCTATCLQTNVNRTIELLGNAFWFYLAAAGKCEPSSEKAEKGGTGN